MDEDLEDIKKLNDILRNENLQSETQEEVQSVLYEESSEEENSEDENDDLKDYNLEPIEDDETDVFESYEENEIIVATDLESLQQYLTAQEYDIISTCEDKLLKKLLILNRVKKVQLLALNKKYRSIISDCNKQIKIHYDETIYQKKLNKHLKSSMFVYSKVGFPYFKDNKYISSPPTLDMQRKKNNNEINTNYLSKYKVWNLKLQLNLKAEVMLEYNSTKFTKSLRELGELKSRKDENYSNEIKAKEKEIESYKKNEKVPALWEDDFLDWDNISRKVFKDKQSSTACRAFWKFYIHPEVNTSAFSNQENENLKLLAEKYHYKNWEDIAVDLGTERSAFIACVQFHSKLNTSYYQRFTPEEDAKLLRIVDECKVADNIHWSKVAYYFKERTKHQLYHRYFYKLKIPEVVNGKFSDTEDVIILCLVKKYGENFSKIANELPTRNSTQISSRYFNYLKHLQLDSKLQLGNWTVEEDQIILDHIKKFGYSKSWKIVAEKLNRNCTHVRHRYNILKREMDQNPGTFDVSTVTRRVHNVLSTQRHNAFTKEMAEYFISQDMLPVVELRNSALVTGRPRRAYIDQQLTDFFKSTAQIRKARIKKKVTENDLHKTAEYIKKILDSLGVRLHIPDLDTIYEPRLDHNDIGILKILQNIRPQCNSNKTIILDRSIKNEIMLVENPPEELDIKGLVPPNLNTLQIVRGLLLKYQEYNNTVLQTIDKRSISEIVIEENENLHGDLNNFRKRFKSLLKWPSILSISAPAKALRCDSTDSESSDVNEDEVLPKIKKAKGRPKKVVYNKVKAMNEGRAKSRTMTYNAVNSSVSNSTNQQSMSKEIVNNVPLTSLEDVKNALAGINKNNTINSPGKYLIKIDKSMIKKLQSNQQKIFVKKDSKPSTSQENTVSVDKPKEISDKIKTFLNQSRISRFKKLYDLPKKTINSKPDTTSIMPTINLKNSTLIRTPTTKTYKKRKHQPVNNLENKKIKLVDINEIMSGNSSFSSIENTDEIKNIDECDDDFDDIDEIKNDILLLDDILHTENNPL